MLGRQRLGCEHVEDGAADPSLAQRRDEGRLVDHRAAADVEEPRRRPHRRQRPRAEEASRAVGQRQHDDHEVGLAERARQRGQPVHALGLAHGAAGAADADDAQAQRARGGGDRAADVAEADDGHRLAREAIGEDLLAPAPLTLRGAIGLRVLGDPQAPAQDVLAHPRPEDAGRARDRHTGREGGDERPVDAGAHRLQPRQPRRARVEVGRKLPGVDDVGVADGGRRLRGRRAHGQTDARARRAHEGRVGLRLVGVKDEDGGRPAPPHVRAAASSASSCEKSTSRRSRPSRRYHAKVCASPEASV